jgi:holo-ACP synthase/triphosphoribosyl-dephospho-CoA synthase
LGRLFDIDVFTPEGTKLSRGAEQRRPCLVCGGDAFACGRSRAHDPAVVVDAALAIMERFVKDRLQARVTSAAANALISEVAVTPKPGLVDRANTGAHRDMDFFSFIDSTSTLLPFFRECAAAGYDYAARQPDAERCTTLPALFDSLRLRGKIAEIDMRAVTGGINTHRGVIFSFGVLSAAYGFLYRDNETPGTPELLEACRAQTCRLLEDFARNSEHYDERGRDSDSANGKADGRVGGPAPSHGEAIYAKLGLRGIRGEVSMGFPTVRAHALPVLKHLLAAGHPMNDAGLGAFLSLLAHTGDTNIVHRGGASTLARIRNETAAFLAANPCLAVMREQAAALDREFTAANISPGGSADLLAVTIFLYRLEQAAVPCGESRSPSGTTRPLLMASYAARPQTLSPTASLPLSPQTAYLQLPLATPPSSPMTRPPQTAHLQPPPPASLPPSCPPRAGEPA